MGPVANQITPENLSKIGCPCCLTVLLLYPLIFFAQLSLPPPPRTPLNHSPTHCYFPLPCGQSIFWRTPTSPYTPLPRPFRLFREPSLRLPPASPLSPSVLLPNCVRGEPSNPHVTFPRDFLHGSIGTEACLKIVLPPRRLSHPPTPHLAPGLTPPTTSSSHPSQHCFLLSLLTAHPLSLLTLPPPPLIPCQPFSYRTALAPFSHHHLFR